jgi:hypothetical protein
MIPQSKLDLKGTSPYWASAIPSDVPGKREELRGEDRLNEVPPELRKSFAKRMEDLVSGKAEERKQGKNSFQPLRQLAQGLRGITTDGSGGSGEGGAVGEGDAGQVGAGAGAKESVKKSLSAAAERAEDDPLNANDRINRYMSSEVQQKEHAFKSFERTLHYDPNAF